MKFKTNKVISTSNLPAKSPMLGTVVYTIAMDYWDAPQWVWGAAGLFFLVVWIIFLASYFNQDNVDIFE